MLWTLGHDSDGTKVLVTPEQAFTKVRSLQHHICEMAFKEASRLASMRLRIQIKYSIVAAKIVIPERPAATVRCRAIFPEDGGVDLSHPNW